MSWHFWSSEISVKVEHGTSAHSIDHISYAPHACAHTHTRTHRCIYLYLDRLVYLSRRWTTIANGLASGLGLIWEGENSPIQCRHLMRQTQTR